MAFDWTAPRPNRQKVVSHAPCAHCGKAMERKRYNGRLEDPKVFARRKFCDATCMAADFDARPVKQDASWATAHHHARKLCPPGPCARCGKARTEVHHKNGDWRDNRPENLERICRGCHTKHHRSASRGG